jgi:hypothetical protein
MICEFCGYEFSDDLGRYGCPNCEGEGTMSNLCRSNLGSANTRKINKALGELKQSVTVKSFGFGRGGSSISVPPGEIEILMTARAIIKREGFEVSKIETYSFESCFYAVRP